MREESIHELGNMAHQRAHLLEGRKGRSALVSSEMWHVANKDLLARGEEEGGGRSRLVSLEMRHVTNEDSLTRGRKEGGGGREVGKCGTSKKQMNEDLIPRGEEKEGGRE